MSLPVCAGLILGLTAAAVILAGVCYGVKEGVERLIGGRDGRKAG